MFVLFEVTQSCPTLCDPVDCSPPGSSVHGILQTRILERVEWVAISFSRQSPPPRDRTRVSYVSCTAGRFFTTGPSLVAQTVKNLPVVQEIQVPSLGQEDPLEKGMATHSRILA